MTEKTPKVSTTMDKDTASARKLVQAVLNDKIEAKLSSITATKKDYYEYLFPCNKENA